MKKYVLEAIINGESKSFKNEFNSRREAIDYIFNYYTNHNLDFLIINDEYVIDEKKHNVEYVSDYNNRFRIARA